MKKLFYTLVIALCCINFATNAQTLKSTKVNFNSLRGDMPNTGFCWADRSTPLNQINAVGARGAANIFVFVETPELKGTHTIKSISFPFPGNSDPNGTVVILKGDSTVLYSEPVNIAGGTWNNFTLKTPQKVTDGKYFIGFFCHSTNAKPYVIPFDGSVIFPQANFIGLIGESRPNLNAKEKVSGLFQSSELQFGSLIVAADIDGPSVENIAVLSNISGGRTGKPNTALPLNIEVRNIGTHAIENGVVSAISQGKSQNFDITNIPVGAKKNFAVNYLLPESGYDLEALFSVKTVNGINNILADFGTSFIYNVQVEGGPFAVKNILIEEFTTERCPNCPRAKPIVEKTIETLENAGYRVSAIAHHAGYYTDFLTLSESDKLVPYMYSNGSFAPAAMVNRVNKGENGTCALGVGGDFSKIAKNIAESTLQAADITSVTFTDNGIDIVGRIAKGVDKNNVYLNVIITEDGIKSQQQSGAKSSYVHDFAARKFIYPFDGQKIEINDDLSFSVKIPAVDLKTNWIKANLKAVAFLTTSKMTRNNMSDYKHRAVIASNFTKFGETSSAQEVASEKPNVTVFNRCVKVEGNYDNFQVFNMAGNIVATDSTPLMEGVYIVKVNNVFGSFTYKVAVK